MSRRPKPPQARLEAAIGHEFADPSLLDRALTHISALVGPRRVDSYQRLEFLGDRVLGLAVSDLLYRLYPDDEEGVLSRRLSELVRKETCAAVAAEWDVGAFLKLGGGEAQSGGRKRLTILGDACEALIGAVYCDAGFEAARAVVERAWADRLAASADTASDAKTALQEWAQARALRTPTYRLVSRSGPDHSPRFTVAVDVESHNAAEGEGRSKRVAEQAAAAAFMTREGLAQGEARHG
jgi:ribonuclease III